METNEINGPLCTVVLYSDDGFLCFDSWVDGITLLVLYVHFCSSPIKEVHPDDRQYVSS